MGATVEFHSHVPITHFGTLASFALAAAIALLFGYLTTFGGGACRLRGRQ